MMGKGKPAPRETAKEKKTSAQKAVPAKAPGKKAVAAPQSQKAAAPKGQKSVAEKASPATPGRSEAAAGKTKAQSASGPKTQSAPLVAPPAKQPDPVATQKPPVPGPSVQKAVAQKGTVQTASEPSAQVQREAQAVIECGELDGVKLPAPGGKVGVFGGPRDRSLKPDDKLGLPTGRHYQFEQFRTLNPKSYYCAMRWEYRQKHMSAEEGKRWWANKKLAVTNPANNKTVVVRAVDYGPHESTGLAISVSPAAAEAIGVEPGQEVVVTFADEKAQLGPLAAPQGSN
jgi:hypothetical protein